MYKKFASLVSMSVSLSVTYSKHLLRLYETSFVGKETRVEWNAVWVSN